VLPLLSATIPPETEETPFLGKKEQLNVAKQQSLIFRALTWIEVPDQADTIET